MNEVLKEAGHGKFTRLEIVAAERDMYQTLNFDLLESTVLDETILALRAGVLPIDPEDGPPTAKTDFELVCTFVAKAYVHDVKLTALPMSSQVYTVITVAIDFYRELLSLKNFRPELQSSSDED